MRLFGIFLISLLFTSCSFIGRSTIPEDSASILNRGITEESPLTKKKDEKSVNKKIVYHTVQKGETLYRLSVNYSVPIEKIAFLNDIDDATRIYVGQVIKVPVKDGGSKVIHSSPPADVKVSKDSFLLRWPLDSAGRDSVQRRFGRIYNSELGVFTNNNGIDIKVEKGEIYAVNDGVVTYLDFLKGIGLMVGFKVDKDYHVFYYPCESVNVKKGDKIKTGQVVAKVSGDILHFEVRKKKLPLNPLLFLP